MSRKVAVVTGAAQGVGLETSQLFATLGYHVVMTDVQPLDGPVACLQADLTQAPRGQQRASLHLGCRPGELEAMIRAQVVHDPVDGPALCRVIEQFDVSTVRFCDLPNQRKTQSVTGNILPPRSPVKGLKDVLALICGYAISKIAYNQFG